MYLHNMLTPLITVTSYAICLISVPFVLNASQLGYAIPFIARYFNVDFYVYKLEPVVLCLGLVTFYTYVLLGFVADLLQAFERESITAERRLFFTKLERAQQELRSLFPPFVVSSLLMYANTTRFDTLRNSFLVFQTLILLVHPIANLCPRSHPGLLCKFLFRATLFWTILFALFPRESQYYISEIAHCTREALGFNKRSYYYQHYQYPSYGRTPQGYSGIDYWIL